MKMKKLIAMFICLFACCLFLASCEEPIGDYLKDYDYKPEPVYSVMYDFYIIAEDGTDSMAKSTVNEKINQVFGDKYNTKLNMIFLSEADYENQLKVDLGLATIDGYNKTVTNLPAGYTYGGRIVLINDATMLNYLGDKLVDLNPYLDTPDFGTLNTQINAPLLSAADVDGKKLAIPNNRVYGEYEYICINRDIAETQLNFSALSELLEIKSMEDAAEIIAAYGGNVSDIVRVVNGQYDLKAKIENQEYAGFTDSRWICNVMTYPTATLEVAYASAYGIIPEADLIVKNDDGEDVVAVDYTYRAMDVVYSFNHEEEMRNLLCYGVPNTNYRLSEDKFVTRLTEQGSNYIINLNYCGDIFKAYYSAEWTKDMAESGKNQVKEAVLSEE